jgi:hypothetical protein
MEKKRQQRGLQPIIMIIWKDQADQNVTAHGRKRKEIRMQS